MLTTFMGVSAFAAVVLVSSHLYDWLMEPAGSTRWSQVNWAAAPARQEVRVRISGSPDSPLLALEQGSPQAQHLLCTWRNWEAWASSCDALRAQLVVAHAQAKTPAPLADSSQATQPNTQAVEGAAFSAVRHVRCTSGVWAVSLHRNESPEPFVLARTDKRCA